MLQGQDGLSTIHQTDGVSDRHCTEGGGGGAATSIPIKIKIGGGGGGAIHSHCPSPTPSPDPSTITSTVYLMSSPYCPLLLLSLFNVQYSELCITFHSVVVVVKWP